MNSKFTKFTRKGKETTYIHYGATEFDAKKCPIIRNRRNWIKPKAHTGLWASPIDTERGWRDWCETEHFRECSDNNAFRFKVRNPEKIFFVDSREAYEELIRNYGINNQHHYVYIPQYIDFEKMLNDEWDGLEISLTDYPQLYELLYGWDCDSILIFIPDAIISETDVERGADIHDEFENTIQRDFMGSGIFGEWDALLYNNQFS